MVIEMYPPSLLQWKILFEKLRKSQQKIRLTYTNEDDIGPLHRLCILTLKFSISLFIQVSGPNQITEIDTLTQC